MRETSCRISFWVITVFSKFWLRFRNSWDDANDFIDIYSCVIFHVSYSCVIFHVSYSCVMCHIYSCVIIHSYSSAKWNILSVCVHVFHKNNSKKFHNSWRIWRWSVELGIQFFFHSCFSKIMLSILFTWRRVKFHVIFDRKNNNNTTLLWRRAYYVL